MGRRRKPSHLKLIQGTERRDRRVVELRPGDPLQELPEVPDWLPNAHAVKEWRRLAPICMRIGTLTEGTLTMFAHLCSIHGKLVQLTQAGETPGAALLGQLRALAADFGLSARVLEPPPLPDGPRPANPFAKFRREPVP